MKIFGIGLPRTGTTSLHLALMHLGYRSKHFAMELYPNCPAELVEPWDAIVDTPVPYFYSALDKQWPGARFILTTRNKEDWLASMNWMLTDGKALWWWDLKTFQFVDMWFGTTRFKVDVLSDFYDRYHSGVSEYFSGREKDLLIVNLDLPGHATSMRLAEFLGCRPSDEEFFPGGGARKARQHAPRFRRLMYDGYRRLLLTPALDRNLTLIIRKLYKKVKKK